MNLPAPLCDLCVSFTAFQLFSFSAFTQAAFLARRWGAPITITRQIAEGIKGNVRAAMADLEMWMG